MAYYGKAVSGNNYKNNGCTILFGGTATAATVNSVGKEITGYPRSSGTQWSTAMNYVDDVISGARLGRMGEGEYIILGVTALIAGAANTFLQKAGGQLAGRRSINFIESIRTTKILTTGGWNYQTGAAVSPTASNDTFKNIRGSGNVDDAAHPTRSAPGEWVFLESFVTWADNYQDYQAKTT